jgi:hypothetical protein
LKRNREKNECKKIGGSKKEEKEQEKDEQKRGEEERGTKKE